MNEKKNFTVLYVEDEIDIREKYQQYLKRFVTTVYIAKDGEEAYKIYKEKKPNILIADINMPKLNGLELSTKIRENDQNTKIILLTAHSDTDYLLAAIDLKLTKYLIKPVSRSDLKDTLNLAIDELSKFSVFSKQLTYLRENYYWDSNAMELYAEDKVVILTKNEKMLTDLLVSKLNTTFTYEDIIYEIWPDEFNDKFSALKTLVKGLRRKLPENSLENVRSMGYKITL